MTTPNAFDQRFPDGPKVYKQFQTQIRMDDEDDDSRTLSFLVSTQDVDRHGDTIDPSGWELDNYVKNPVVLWAHDQSELPVAKASNIVAGENGLLSDATFTTREENPKGDMVYRLYKGGFLHACSVGFLTLEWTVNEERAGWLPMDILRAELVEWSAVPVPSNPEALLAARSAGINTAPALEWAQKLLDLKRHDEHSPEFLQATRKAAGAPSVFALSEQISKLAQRVDAMEAKSANPENASKGAEPQTKSAPVVIRLRQAGD